MNAIHLIQVKYLIRDFLKEIYRVYIQIITRFLIQRSSRTWIHINARLDVIPSNKSQKRHTLALKKGAFIESRCVVNTWHGNVIFGENSRIGVNTIIIGPITIGKNVNIAQNCFLSGENHKYYDISKPLFEQGFDVKAIIINDNVWIGANCTILPGVEIGEHSIIGAGTVLTKTIPAYSVVVGNPAHIIKTFNHIKGIWERTNN